MLQGFLGHDLPIRLFLGRVIRLADRKPWPLKQAKYDHCAAQQNYENFGHENEIYEARMQSLNQCERAVKVLGKQGLLPRTNVRRLAKKGAAMLAARPCAAAQDTRE
jgi:hypothetical protein